MLFFTFYYNAFLMGSITVLFHHVLKQFNVETKLFEKYSVNMMRSLICGTIAHEAYKNYKYLWMDKCLDNELMYNRFEDYHNMFLSYFIYDKMYGLTILIGLSEGMSFVSGPKLLSMYFNNKYLTNIFIIFRLLYLIFVRMFFLWPSLIYYYHISTSQCIKYQQERNILLVIALISMIFHAEISWLHSGRKELARI